MTQTIGLEYGQIHSRKRRISLSANMNDANKYPMVSVIISDYNGIEYLASCVGSVLNTDYPNFEVILVDNASTDGSLDVARKLFSSDPRVKIICNKENLGFTGGNNVGVEYANGKYLLFLNVDTKVDPAWLKELVKVMEENSRIGIAQCKILLMDNPKILDNAGHYIDSFGLTYWIGYLEEDKGQYDHGYEMFGACGAALAIRTTLFRKLGGFDPDFFIFFDESDLCWRVWLTGYKVVFIPNAIVYHKGGFSYKSKGYVAKKTFPTSFLYVRNRLSSMIKNYELMNLLKFVPANILIMLGLSLLSVKNGDIGDAQAIKNGLFWNIHNLKKIILKRIAVQRIRTVGDISLANKGVIKKVDIRIAINKIAIERARTEKLMESKLFK
jgi:GT2 family glycosyltransferase